LTRCAASARSPCVRAGVCVARPFVARRGCPWPAWCSQESVVDFLRDKSCSVELLLESLQIMHRCVRRHWPPLCVCVVGPAVVQPRHPCGRAVARAASTRRWSATWC
jgi:hypothetical protein